MTTAPKNTGAKTDDKPAPSQGQGDDVKALPAGDSTEDRSAADWLNPTVHDGELVDDKPAETNKQKRDRLKAELAEAEAAAMVVSAPPHDVLLVLAGGEIVESSGAIPTHHASTVGGYALPVVAVLPHPNVLNPA